ncbi:hypothetical protein CMV00_18250 [Elizabethkingia anophelis]|nr:hypothetical protein [Elizabethkingia anophelis]
MEAETINYQSKYGPNTNFQFPTDEDTQYLKTSAGEVLPYKLFSGRNDADPNSALLREKDNQGYANDFALVERQFSENKSLSFMAGTKVSDVNDVAWLFRALEDEAVEHTFALYKFKDDSYLVQHLSTGGITSTVVDLRLLTGNVFKMQPESITLVHNHPSGQLISSKHDRLMLQRLHEIFDHTGIKVEDGIVINLRSGKYLVFNGDLGSDRVLELSEQNQQQGKVSTFSFNKQIFAANYQPFKINSPEDSAAYISSQKFGLSDKTEAIILNNANDIVGKFILPQHRQFEKLTELMTIHAGTGVILYGNNVNEQMYKEYRDKLELMGFTALDAILLESGNYHSLYEKTKINVYDHLLDKFSKNHLNAEPIVGVSENNENDSYSKNFRNMEEPPQKDYVKLFIDDSEGHTKHEFEISLTEDDKENYSQIASKIQLYRKPEDHVLLFVGGELLTYEGNEETEKIIDSLKSLFLPEDKKRSNLFSQNNFHSRFKEEMDATRSGFSIDDIIGEPSTKHYAKMNGNTLTQQPNKNKEYFNNQIPNIMETQKEFNQVDYLKNQLKYLGFGEDEKLHKELEKGIKSKNQQFEIKTSSDKALPGNEVDFALKFNKTESGGVFLNSYDAQLKNEKGEEITHNFSVNRENTFTAKEAVNLLEGRSVKIEFHNPKSDQSETAFVQFNFEEPKTEKGNYMFQNFYKNYGVDTDKIVEKANLVFDKPEYRENTIKSLEKGNVVKVKFEMDDKVVEGKAVLNPQYKNLNLYDSDMNRINTNKPLQGLENEEKQEKAHVKEQSIKR